MNRTEPVRVYVSHSFTDEAKEIKEELLQYLSERLPYCCFILPVEVDLKYPSFVYSDLMELEKVDVLLAILPSPTVGTVAELAYFKTKFPFKMTVGYKCCEHPWLRLFLLDFMVDSREEVVEIFESYRKSKYCRG